MLLPGENSPKTWLFITILVSTIIASSESSRSRMLDFKIGFGLIQGSTEVPALRFRDIKGSTEFNPRAMEKESDLDESISAGVNSNSASKEQPLPKKDDSSKEKDKSDEEEDRGDDGHDDDDVERITRGPKNNDFEPEEENPSIHAKFNKDSDSDKSSNEDRRRYKRHITYSVM